MNRGCYVRVGQGKSAFFYYVFNENLEYEALL